jgi:hypothetical protein
MQRCVIVQGGYSVPDHFDWRREHLLHNERSGLHTDRPARPQPDC